MARFLLLQIAAVANGLDRAAVLALAADDAALNIDSGLTLVQFYGLHGAGLGAAAAAYAGVCPYLHFKGTGHLLPDDMAQGVKRTYRAQQAAVAASAFSEKSQQHVGQQKGGQQGKGAADQYTCV